MNKSKKIIKPKEITKYYQKLKGLAISINSGSYRTSRIIKNDADAKIILAPHTNNLWSISTTEPFDLGNNKQFDFAERIGLKDNKINLVAYRYAYEDTSFYFHYDKDEKRQERYLHPLCHLHVNARSPRYITHETSFEEVFRFVIHNQLNIPIWDGD